MIAILAAALLGQQHHHHHHEPVPGDAVLEVTISPEARVSVRPVRPLPPLADCSRPLEIPVAVANAFEAPTPLTVAAEPARLVGPASFRLTGARSETIRIFLGASAGEAVEIALRFDAGPATADLGWRSEANLLIQCAGGAGNSAGSGPGAARR